MVRRPFTTGRIKLAAEAERRVNEIEDWIAKNAMTELVVNVVGVFRGGQNWEAALNTDEDS